MTPTTIVLGIIGFAAAAGASAVFFKRGSGVETINLLKTNIGAYKEAIKLKDERITYLEGIVYSQGETIKKLSESK